jgi:hypothetical protein
MTASAVAAPATIVAALAFYIGTVRQETFSRYFGLDVSLLGLTPQDYMLRSTDTLVPFLVGVCVLLLVVAGGWALVGVSLQRRPAVRSLAAWFAIGLGVAAVAVGVWRLARPVPLTGTHRIGPLSLGLGALLLAAGVRLVVRHGPAQLRQLPSAVWTAATTATVVLLLAALFWAANDYARVQGAQRAQEMAAGLAALPGVVVHSDRQLHLSAAGVEEEVLPAETGDTGEPGADRYRYHGLRLLIRSDGRYFLIPASWSRTSGAVVVLPDDERIQLEFFPAGRP